MTRDLKRWLSEIGLGGRTELFVAHDVDWDVLGDLSNEDLKDLGLSLGERKRLLKAIATLNASTPASLGGDAPAWQSSNAKGEAERRQITVMFVDLVDSTPLAERLDPEELREVLRIFHAECAGVIETEEGHTARYLGDGVLVYFGYPQAHEDDAARAVRAGLRIIEKLQAANGRLEQKHGVQLRSRIGIQSGLVVVGEVGAGTARDPQAIVGETPNIAARLQGEAQPDTVVIGEPTQHLVEGLFEFEDLGSRRLKGVSDPVRAWRVLREVAAVDRFDARIRRGLTPLIGRAAELEMLNQRWAQACDGEMRCVLVAGEAGIGKSRLIRAFRDGLGGHPHETITLYCSPYHTHSAFAPLSDWLRRALHLNPRDDPAGSIATLTSAAGRLGLDGHNTMPVLLTLLGLPAIGEDQPAETTTTLFKHRVVETIAAVIAGLARQQPVIMLVEDAHWIDPSTHELLRELLEQLTTLQLLLLITARPEFKPGWSYPQAVQLNLDRLSRRDRIAMVERVAGGKKLPDFVLEQIVTKTDGVPLFVEELTKTVLEGDVLRDAGDRYEPSGAFEGIAIPDTLQGSLLARLDRLPIEAKEIAQISAAIGREFSRDLLALVAGRPGNVLDSALDQLVAAEILQPAPRSTWGQGAYAFRHALIQEAAYSSLLLSRRRQFHAAIADALTGSFPELAAMLPELVAQHLTAADLFDSAIDAWLRAGDKAKRRGAFLEALAHLERGTELVQRLPQSERAQRTVSLLLARAAVDTQLANPRAVSTLRKAAEISRAKELTAEFVGAALGFADAELWNNTPTIESVDLLEEALTAVGSAETVERNRILSKLSRSLLYVGAVDRAQNVMREANALAQRLGDVQCERELLWCELTPNGASPALAGQFGERRRLLQRLQQLAELDSDYKYMANGIALTAPAFLEMGDADEFEAIVHRYERLSTFAQSRLDRWSVTTMQAMGAILRGEFLSAERLAAEAMELGDDSNFNIPVGIYGLQMFTIRREQGRLTEVAPFLKRFVDENPESAVWRPGLMLIASDLGFAEQARATFNAMAATGFAFPFDTKRTATLSYLTEVCCRLEDRANAERLYELLQPYRDLAIVVGQGTICCGAVARYLGMLAATLRDWPAAEAHFEAALAMNERMKGWPWLAHTRFDYSRALLARGSKKDAIRIRELRGMALAAAERLEMGGLSQRITNELPG